MYTEKDVYKNTLEYYGGDTLATKVWMDKYCLRDSEGAFLEASPLDMYRRLAKEFARIESKYPNAITEEEIYSLLESRTILPAGSILYGLGNNMSYSTLANCYVIGNTADSYGGIMQVDEEQVQLMKRRR